MEISKFNFDPHRALEYAAVIAKPRLVGTQQEREAGEYIDSRLDAIDFEVTPEEFHFSDTMSVFLVIEILFSQILIIITFWLHSNENPLQFLTALLLLLFLIVVNPINRLVQEISLAPFHGDTTRFITKLIQGAGKSYRTINYVAKYPGSRSEPADIHLTLVAHYDTKSQRMPLVIRIALFTLGIGCELLFAIFVLFTPILPTLSIPAMVIGVIALFLGIPLLFLDLGNESPGAIDNASSVGLLLHLAEVLGQHPDVCHRLDLTFLFTSAEEISTSGALAYTRRHEIQLRQQAKMGQSYVLNFDGIGVGGSLFWVGRGRRSGFLANNSLVYFIHQVCKDLHIELKRFNLPGALYDHIPFSDMGLEACTLIAIDRKSLSIHTRRDTIEQLEPKGFQQTGQVVLRMIDILLQ